MFMFLHLVCHVDVLGSLILGCCTCLGNLRPQKVLKMRWRSGFLIFDEFDYQFLGKTQNEGASYYW